MDKVLSKNEKIQNMSLLCAFLVVIIHCRPQFEIGTFWWWVKQMLEEGICTIAVPFFFLISGYFLSRHIVDVGWYKREVSKRIFSLLLPYCIWCFLYSFPFVILGTIPFSIYNIFGFDLVALPSLTPLWYIRGLFILVLLSPLFVFYLRTRWIGLILLFLCYGLICPGPKGSGFLHGITRCGLFPMAGVFYFTLGLFIGKNKIQFKFTKAISLGCLFIGLLFSFMQAFFYYQGLTVWMQHWGWLAIPFTMAGIWGGIPSRSWSHTLVMTSFPIYVMHKFFYFGVLRFIENSNGGGTSFQLLLFLYFPYVRLFSSKKVFLEHQNGSLAVVRTRSCNA